MMQYSGIQPKRFPAQAFLISIAFWLAISGNDAARAADCTTYKVLIEQGTEQWPTAGDRLHADTRNRACAFYLAQAYFRGGNREAAIQWINFARLFVNTELDHDLYPRIVQLKLLLAPDTPLEVRGLSEPGPYDPQADYEFLQRDSPTLFETLQQQARRPYDDEIRSFRAQPWDRDCPQTTRFWDEKFGIPTSDLRRISNQVTAYRNALQEEEYSREQVLGIDDALNQLQELGVEVTSRRKTYSQRASYYRIEEQATNETLSNRQRANLLDKALGALKDASITDWDPANVGTRSERAALMADIEEQIASEAPIPDSRLGEVWKERAERLPNGYELGTEYADTIAILSLRSECRKDDGCAENLCRSDPCRRFAEDRRVLGQQLVGRELLLILQQQERESIIRKTAGFVKEAEAFLSPQEPPTGPDANIERVRGFLWLLESEYADYADMTRVRQLRVMADIDADLAAAPPRFSEADTDWLERLRARVPSEDLAPSYAAAIRILQGYDGCVQNLSAGLLPSDPCHEAADSPYWGIEYEIRRRISLVRYQTGAINALRRKANRALGDINRLLESPDPPIPSINEQLHFLYQHYGEYIDQQQEALFESARQTLREPGRIVVPIRESTLFDTGPDDTEQTSVISDIQSIMEAPPSIPPEPAQHGEPMANGLPTAGGEQAETHPVADSGSDQDQIENDLSELDERLEREVPFFDVALAVWQGRDPPQNASSETSERLARAIEMLKNANHDDTNQMRITVSELSAFCQSVRGESSDRQGADFIRFYFQSRRYLQMSKFEKALLMIQQARSFELTQAMEDAFRKIEEAIERHRSKAP